MSSNDALLKLFIIGLGQVEFRNDESSDPIAEAVDRRRRTKFLHDISKCPNCDECQATRQRVKSWIEADANAIRYLSEDS